MKKNEASRSVWALFSILAFAMCFEHGAPIVQAIVGINFLAAFCVQMYHSVKNKV